MLLTYTTLKSLSHTVHIVEERLNNYLLRFNNGRDFFFLSFFVLYGSQRRDCLDPSHEVFSIAYNLPQFNHSRPIFSCYLLYAIHISFLLYSSDFSSLCTFFHYVFLTSTIQTACTSYLRLS